jgi:hypothetical protein
MNNPNKRDSEVATRVKRTAELTGVDVRSVYRVLNGDQKNEIVLSTYMQLQEGETLLMQAVKELVPFN